MPTPIESIGQIAISTHDLSRAVAFYRDALGLDYLFEAGPLAFFMCGDVRLMLAVPETSEVDHPSSIIYFRVENRSRARRARRPRGAFRRRAAPDRTHAGPRALDDVLPRPRPKPARADERGHVDSVSTTVTSRPRSSGTVTDTCAGSLCRAAEYAASVFACETTLSATTSAPGSSRPRTSVKSAS